MKKKLFLMGMLAFGLVLAVCASGASNASSANSSTSKSRYIGVYLSVEPEPVTVNYTVSDAAAFSIAHAWATQEMKTGAASITVNDSATGILAGNDDYDYVVAIDAFKCSYRVVVRNGQATLTIPKLTLGAYESTSVDAAKTEAQQFLDNRVNEIINSFKKAYE